MSNNFLQFDQNAANMLDDDAYLANSQRIGGVVPGIASSALHNKLYYQTSTMTAAFGQFMSNRGFTVSDANLAALVNVITACFAGVPGAGWGCFAANNNSDPNNDIDISPGLWLDSTGVIVMNLVSALTKQLDASWVAGNNQGGLFTGTKAANTAYHVFLISTAAGVTDIGFDTSLTAANRPITYVYYRRLWTIYTDNSLNIIPFRQVGDMCIFRTPVQNTATLNTSPTNLAITTPPGIEVYANVSFGATTATVSTLRSFQMDLSHPSDTPTPVFRFGLNGPTTGNMSAYGTAWCPTNTSSQIRYLAGTTGAISGAYLSTLGYLDNRGKVY